MFGEEKCVVVFGVMGNDVGDIVGYLVKGVLEGCDLLVFFVGQVIGVDDVLQYYYGGGVEDGEDSQCQQCFDQSEIVYFCYYGGVIQVCRVVSGVGLFFCCWIFMFSVCSCGSVVFIFCQ